MLLRGATLAALIAFGEATAMAFAKRCVSGAAMAALRKNVPGAVGFCREYLGSSVRAAERVSTTTVISNETVTHMVTMTPTLVFTVYGDVLVTVTTTELCIGTAEARSAVASETAPARGEPGHGYSGVVHGLEERRVAVPSYVATFETAQLSSACGCLVGFASRATATRAAVLQTVTENVAIATHVITTVGHVVQSIQFIGETRTATETACI